MSFLADIYEGDGSNMRHVGDGEADLVLTSPPYYPDSIEETLRLPVGKQTAVESVEQAVFSFQRSLWGVLAECGRVLRPGGTLCMVSSDIRFGGFLFSVIAMLREGAEKAGFRLFSRTHLRMIGYRRRLSPHNGRAFRCDDTSAIEVFSRGFEQSAITRPELTDVEFKKLSSPFWVVSSAGIGRIHPHQLSSTVVRRLLTLYSSEGDLVVDPFAGSGGTILHAALMGRRGVGYEIVPERAGVASAHLRKKLRKLVIT
jgi:site-specific DNA-methyltransferase (adenine-specific)